ncbi:30S ribosomal protein S17 [Candidatus Saccharibacteria bacterium]|nr:MAG: 30S ribosomal protein S17 [Candidatus Saccharibacteria bacterium]
MAKRTLTGVVTSAKRDKTVTVTVVSRETHPLYGKQYTVTRKYTAHNDNNQASEGDTVLIEETRPISKTKSFTVVKVVEKSRGSVQLKEDVVKAETEVKEEE